MPSTDLSQNYSHITSSNASLNGDCIELRFNEMEFLPWDNPDNIVGEHVEKAVGRIKNYVTVCFAFIGMPANIINMAVFFKQSLKDRVNLCLFSLSLADELSLVIATLDMSETTFESKNYGPVTTFLSNNNLIVFYGCMLVSLVTSAIIACERCFCVLNPLKCQTVLRTRTMACILVTVDLVILSLFYIVSFRYHIGCIYDPDIGMQFRTLVVNTFYERHQQLVNILDQFVLGVGLIGTTITVVVTTTTITAVRLRQVVKWRTDTSSSLSSREVALTKMLIGTSVFFTFCAFPSLVFRLVSFFFPDVAAGGRNHNFYLVCVWIIEALGVVNSSFNIFIYYAMGSRYRETFWTLFCKKARTEKA